MRTILVRVLTVSVALAAAIAPTHAGGLLSPPPAPVPTTVVDMIDLLTFEAVEGASILARSAKGVRATVNTSGLDADASYSIWWVVFNHPEHCIDGCDEGDFEIPEVESSVLWASGFVTGPDGTANVDFELRKLRAPGEVLFGPGLLRPMDAEIHVVLRTHGPRVAGDVARQISSFDGECDPAVCWDQQAAIHVP